MRVALLIIGLVLSLVFLLQSCAVATVGSAIDRAQGWQPSGAAVGAQYGIIGAICGVVGAAFALKIPLVSVFAFALGAYLAARSTEWGFDDGAIWAGVLGVLMVLAIIAHWRLLGEKRWAKMR